MQWRLFSSFCSHSSQLPTLYTLFCLLSITSPPQPPRCLSFASFTKIPDSTKLGNGIIAFGCGPATAPSILASVISRCFQSTLDCCRTLGKGFERRGAVGISLFIWVRRERKSAGKVRESAWQGVAFCNSSNVRSLDEDTRAQVLWS